MATPHTTVIVPREAPVYSADGVKLGIVNTVGRACLRIRQGRFIAHYLDLPVDCVDRVEHGRLWLNTAIDMTLATARPVATATDPEAVTIDAAPEPIAAD